MSHPAPASRVSPRRGRPRGVGPASLAIGLLLAAAGPAVAQSVAPQLRGTFEQASDLFPRGEYQEAIQGFTEVIDELEQRALQGPLTDDERALLLDSLAYRARATANATDLDSTRPDLQRIIELAPGYQLDLTVVSPRLAEMFTELQAELLGELYLDVSPRDATVRIDDQPVTSPATLSLLVGAHVLTAERPGYTPLREEITVETGEPARLTPVLERTSAVLKIVTRPPGASVSIDGTPAGATSGTLGADVPLRDGAAEFSREDFSGELQIGLPTGPHELAVALDGYRVYRSKVAVPDAVDYSIAPIILTPTGGTLSFRNLPPGASLTVDGQPRNADLSPDGRLALPVGEHLVRVTSGTAGVFERAVTLDDGALTDVTVKLQPTVAYLGALNSDRIGDAPAREAMTRIFDQSADGWLLVDRSESVKGLMQQAGMDIESLQRLAETGRMEESATEWASLQQLAQADAPGSVYVLGVLSDNVFADHIDLWIWRPAPHPARPDLLRIPLEAGRTPVVPDELTRPFRVQRAWLGARLIDSDAAAGPVIVSVAPESPAARAGLEVGDVLEALWSAPVQSVREALDMLQAAPPGSTVELEVSQGSQSRDVTLTLGASPEIMSRQDPRFLYSLLSARSEQLLQAAAPDGPADWVLRLNQALAYFRLQAWDEATIALQEVGAPGGPGLGQATIDYWLGIALSELGSNYRSPARDAFERAAAAAEARLYHNDGPLVAPRARARLRKLGAAP